MERRVIRNELKQQKLFQRQYSEAILEKDEYAVWMQSVRATLGILRSRPWHVTIFKVPNRLRRLKEESYVPCLVSIGPLHHGSSELLPMEERKWMYLLSLLHRTTDPEKTLDELSHAVSSQEERARGCYADNIRFNRVELTEIFLLDACFVLELFLRLSDKKFTESTDPIVNNAWMIPTIRFDLLLLENQIPFFILQKLFDIVEKSISDILPYSLKEYALFFLQPALLAFDPFVDEDACLNPWHLLQILHNLYLPSSRDKTTPAESTPIWGFKHCATKLAESGIEFKKGTTGNMLDVTFREGLLVIPPVEIGERTEILLKNLIALEQSQCCSVSPDHITSYVLLMKSLIRSPQDVGFLLRKGIVNKNCVGENAYVFFKGMCREVVFRGFYFTELCEEVNAYRKSWLHGQRLRAMLRFRWIRYVAALRRDYFSNPWRIISFVAAIVLLILTALQTIYTMNAKL